jgi:uncharacterized protein YbgA (DUF1722 family)
VHACWVNLFVAMAAISLTIFGYIKKDLDASEKQEILGIIDEYRREFIPLIVPITLISHYDRKYDQFYLGDSDLIKLMLQEPRLIRRPWVRIGKEVYFSADSKVLAELLK